MGSCSAYGTMDAYSAEEGFERLRGELVAEHGHDGYNGTLSTCGLVGAVQLANADREAYATAASMEKAERLADAALERASKWQARAVDAGRVGYDVVTRKVVQDSKRFEAKYATRYVVLVDGQPAAGREDGFTDAAGAKRYALRCKGSVRIERRHVLVSGCEDSWSVVETVKRVKKAPKSVPENSEVHEVRRYVYAGWAAC